MIERLKPYAEYKESGLPWLGRCPKNWSVRRTKILFHERVQKGFPNEPLLAATQTKGVVKKEDYETRTVTAQKDLHLLKLVEVGDYVISLRSFQGGIEVAHCRGIISPAYTVLKPRKSATSGYYSHFFKAKPFIDSLSLFVTGIREGQNIDYERLSRAELPMPSEDEQAAIVRFLDHANRKIDGFIRAKRKLIGLLNEQKQAIIHRAVTRGLHPDVPLKPSGIPWLGDIPMHWEMSRACRLFRQVTRFIATGDEPKMSMSRHYGLIRSSELSNRAAQAATSIKFSVCIPDDLVLNKYQAHNGLFGAAIEKGLITSNYSVFKPLNGACTPYFAALFASPTYRGEFRMRCQGVGDGMMPLYSDAFLKTPTIAPPVEEQRAIVAYLIQATKTVTETIARTEREIALMQEYRTRLTADLVTGKLDVREAAAHLPAQPTLTDDEPAPDDSLEEIETEEIEA